ncbi:type II toxin-antitoxin system HicB family antitoxin [Pseudonocardia sp. CA-142604]|uniref:type II toxin-antitoxin system HicB family antitoxin n=1 Tax=Pseudonocardia sp. CA-142604 TaxID=3240024 RepID=UPI003D8DBCEF
MSTTTASLEELLAIPYVLDVRAVQREDGEWMCRVGYDELPGCVAEGRTPFEALTRLERLRVEIVTDLYEQGRPVPAPRAPLRV